jgi:hypothetical protein
VLPIRERNDTQRRDVKFCLKCALEVFKDAKVYECNDNDFCYPFGYDACNRQTSGSLYGQNQRVSSKTRGDQVTQPRKGEKWYGKPYEKRGKSR